MKKMAVLFTILLCAGALNGMEQTGYIESLPKEVKGLIIMYLNEYNDPDQLVKAIRATSLTNKDLNLIINEMYGNQKGFTAIVHMLADKFKDEFNENTHSIAKKFKTPASRAYIALNQKLIQELSLKKLNINKVIELINQGVDVNFTSGYHIFNTHTNELTYYEISPLLLAIGKGDIPLVKLLLDSGAKPLSEDYYERNITDKRPMDPIIKQLLEDAKKKK